MYKLSVRSKRRKKSHSKAQIGLKFSGDGYLADVFRVIPVPHWGDVTIQQSRQPKTTIFRNDVEETLHDTPKHGRIQFLHHHHSHPPHHRSNF